MAEPFRTTRRVEFHETDMAGMVHFSNFFRYMEYAEAAFLRARGLTVAWRDAAGGRLGLPRVAAACDYVAPARFEDVLDIDVTLARVGSKSVTYEFVFSRDGAVLARGRVSAVCCRTGPDGALTSVAIPPEVRARLEGPEGG
jgi:YbgC/YbaW family acyl-CoA thioester hydrolase